MLLRIVLTDALLSGEDSGPALAAEPAKSGTSPTTARATSESVQEETALASPKPISSMSMVSLKTPEPRGPMEQGQAP